jgi:hypothetical protein
MILLKILLSHDPETGALVTYVAYKYEVPNGALGDHQVHMVSKRHRFRPLRRALKRGA